MSSGDRLETPVELDARQAAVARRRAWADPRLWVGLAAVLVLAVALSAYEAATGRPFADQALTLVVNVAAMVAAAGASRRCHGRLRVLWSWVAVGLALGAAGATVIGYAQITADEPVGRTHLGWAFVFAGYGAAVVAVLRGLPIRPARTVWRAALSATCLAVSVWVVAFVILGGEQVIDERGIDWAVPVLSLLLDAALVSLVLTVGGAVARFLPVSVWLCGLGWGVLVLADAADFHNVALGLNAGENFVGIGWTVAYGLLATAAYVAGRHEVGEPQPLAYTTASGISLPFAGTAVAGVVVVAHLTDGSDRLWIAPVALLMVCMAIRLRPLLRERDEAVQRLEAIAFDHERRSVTDTLTGVHNRRFFDERLERELARPAGRAVGLVIVDIDHFKAVNDTHGHPAGDAVLREFAARLRGVARGGDWCCRLGREEFALLLPDAATEGAERLAERARAAVAARPFALDPGLQLDLTASFGVATGGAGTSAAALFARADTALLDAKRAGRDRVRVAADATAAPVPA